jgi:N-acyl homoserine lactone hydrolase
LGAHVCLDHSGTFLLAADAAPVKASLSGRYAPANTQDVGLYLRSLDEIARIERAGATVLFGHDDEQWQGLKRGAQFYA